MALRLNQDFLEKIVILLLTALLTGFLVPYVLKRVDEAKSVQQKIFEADLARQAKVIEAQSKFLDEITETLWNWRYLSMKVAYYGMGDQGPSYAAARKDYDLQIWDVLNRLRNQINRSRRLASEGRTKCWSLSTIESSRLMPNSLRLRASRQAPNSLKNCQN
jgi:hypothetical protein